MNRVCRCNFDQPLPSQCFGWDGARMTTVEQIEAKTRRNLFANDYHCAQPYQVFESARNPVTNLYPPCGGCGPHLVGLTQEQVVQGENEMILYSTYTRCHGEFNDRYFSVQM